MSDEITEETWKEAKEELERAIKAFYGTVEPEMYVEDWVLVVSKASTELLAANQSMVSVTVPFGQAFHRTTGMLVHGVHSTTHF